jgi:hypothetical protein
VTVIEIKRWNRATKIPEVLRRYRVTYARPHGRRNVHKRMKIRRIS